MGKTPTCGGTVRPDAGPAETVALTVGTAGHIDHGKTALVRLLTGCETDTLPEEKARGMTIDLGYATCLLPDGRRVGIVDVPGHERFIHNMVAGASGMDVAMLVVAADDGVMPQTIEHFHILRLLGIRSGMVAITKIDIVPPERVVEVEAQVRQLVAGSFLEGCPVAPVSSKTGAGYDGFYEAFVALVNRTARRNLEGAFRVHVENAFVLSGLGLIISGIPRAGIVRVGEEVEILPAGVRRRVRGIQVYGNDSKEGRAGECLAIRLADTSRDEVPRGTVLGTPGYFTPARFFDIQFHSLPGLDRPIKPRTAVRVHIGTADLIGHLVLPENERMAPGGECYAQVQLGVATVAAPGDFLVVRELSPARTIGGGHVVAPGSVKMRRGRGEWEESCAERERAFADAASAVLYVVEKQVRDPLFPAEIAHLAFLNEETGRKEVAGLVAQGAVVEVAGGRCVHRSVLESAQEEIRAALAAFHDREPLSLGIARRDLLRDLKSNRMVVDCALDDLIKAGRVATQAAGLHLPDRVPKLTERQMKIADRIREIYRKGGFTTPREDELPVLLGMPAALIAPVFEHLVQSGELVVISDKVALHREAVEVSRQKLVEHIRTKGPLDSGAFKDLIGTTRKFSIPLLEYWDAKGLTRRVGNTRVLRDG